MTIILFILITIGIILYIAYFTIQMLLDERHVQARLAREAQQKKQKTQTVVERRTETVTETVRIELVPNEELSLGLTNLIGAIDHNTDATHHHAQVIETTAHIIPLSQPVPQQVTLEIQEKSDRVAQESEVSQSVPNSVPPALNQVFQGVPPEHVVQAYLVEHGSASIREIVRETGLSQGTISRTNAWKNRPK